MGSFLLNAYNSGAYSPEHGLLLSKVLAALDSKEASRIAETHGPPDLLISRPEPELAGHLARMHPQLRVLYLGGYADGLAAHDQELPPRTSLLQKPFAPETLLAAVLARLSQSLSSIQPQDVLRLSFITFITLLLTCTIRAVYDQIYINRMKARSEPYLRSQEVADVLGITKRTLMNWLRTEKIAEPERNQANRYRRWTAQDVERIRQTIAEKNSD